MFNNIFETVVRGSNTMFLDIPSQDYFFSYSNLNKKFAEDISTNYFMMKQKDGIPKVEDINFNSETDTVKITLKVDYNQDNSKIYNVPDMLNVNRNE